MHQVGWDQREILTVKDHGFSCIKGNINLHTVLPTETCHRAAWGKTCVPPLGPGPWWGDSPPYSSNTTPDVSGHKGWNVQPAQSYWELWASKTNVFMFGADQTSQTTRRETLTLRLFGLFILQDGQRQTGVETAELVGEQGEEATTEIWGRSKIHVDKRGVCG